MKTKYKILIACTLVLSLLTAFAVTSFAAYTTTDITYGDNTYEFNQYYINSNTQTPYLQLWGYNSLTIIKNGVEVDIYDSPYVIIYAERDERIDLAIYYINNGEQTNYWYNESSDDLTIIYTGDLKLGYLPAATYNANISNIYVASEPLQYDVWQNTDMSTYGMQFNLLNFREPNPLDKVNDFLGYLSTALNKLTTMIITNQILILFIVAVPVVSFVIGSFKRIKDAGRV